MPCTWFTIRGVQSMWRKNKLFYWHIERGIWVWLVSRNNQNISCWGKMHIIIRYWLSLLKSWWIEASMQSVMAYYILNNLLLCYMWKLSCTGYIWGIVTGTSSEQKELAENEYERGLLECVSRIRMLERINLYSDCYELHIVMLFLMYNGWFWQPL